jgi:hypothetical protein
MRTCKHDNVVPGRKPGTERCKDCSWVFPCREDSCGHMDCIDFKGELPRCHYCDKRVQGSPGGICSPSSQVPEMRVDGGPDASWTPWSVRGVTRAVHYTCRSQHATAEERARWGESC